ncbi:type II toxin-antitoxin system VapC family toxin [Propionimicrobium sp. PCR01-08-3]|uniref:type II toxin-antitoxin system VapC family toxin n=1 Tax=Propionimicrobium sp. PCR01-08-3 TaxID=3052086 RepID=UPI00255C37E6|nr:type II toxin-antitoxin system VapC family toxin [Propionimicrobium sp. PCR01-08-3]WIY82295.1 type II toxin-antitoxin system VapC family toxin [Propionimicrobium sp. PCR01-08-3]
MSSLVLDASAAAELLLGRGRAPSIAKAAVKYDMHAPQLLVVEVASVLRGWTLSHQITEVRARRALDDLRLLGIQLYDLWPLVIDGWRHIHNVSMYDATYVALAQALKCRVVTCDLKLAAAVGDVAWVPDEG